jgi:hypothetical protein
MNIRHVALLILAACAISGCDESVPLNYSTRAEAEAESLFARGWLPEIIPPSSRQISMRNDLDLNISNGEFSFDPSEHDVFVSQLERVPSRDEGGSLAYTYEDWFFWITGAKDHARFSMRLTTKKTPSEQGVGGQPATPPRVGD